LESQFSETKVLADLGLTLKQARIFLALSKYGPLKILEISKLARVARPDVYKVITKLQELGLVERILRKPVEYRAIPIKKGVSLLLERKEAQFRKIETETKILLDTIETKNSLKLDQIKDPQLVLIPEGKLVIERIRSSIEKAESSIDLLLSFKRFSRGIVSTFAESIESAWARNVKTRFLVEMPLESKTSKQLVQFCKEKPSSEVRFIPFYPKTILGIYDRQEMFVITNPKTDLPDSSALWTTNDSLIYLAEDHFGCLWSSAVKKFSVG
jgi:sugar-specific transcriptional regulator TrmB